MQSSPAAPSPVDIEEGTWKTVLAHYLELLLEYNAFNVVMVVATVFVLFAEELNMWVLPKSADTPIGALVFACLILFVIEFLANTIARPQLNFKFFWWLDLLAIVSLIPSAIELFEPGAALSTIDFALARAGRAARASTRAGRLVRVIKFFQMLKKVPSRGGVLRCFCWPSGKG
jgi:hypothetical protein